MRYETAGAVYQTGSTKARHEKPPKSCSMMAASWFSNTPVLNGALCENRSPKDFPTKSLGKANWIGIFAFENFHHGNDFKPLSTAQIRRLEPCA
jgi:hypothetical protein